MELTASDRPAAPASTVHEHLSYKFERLRERLRQAIASGELSGKLPGERELAHHFHANPKTLSKALTDLAAEGLLERSIGRGTFVRGTMPQEISKAQWLVLTDESPDCSPMLQALRGQDTPVECISPATQMRPSFLERFSGAIDLSASTPLSLLRNMLVRGMNIVRVGREPGPVQTHAVLLDTTHAATLLTRQLLMAGHRHILVIETPGRHAVSDAVLMAVQRYAPATTVTVDYSGNIAPAIESGATALLCDSEPAARLAVRLAGANPRFAEVSIAAVGLCPDEPCCTGVYITPAELAGATAELLNDASLRRPTILWLSGRTVDRGTIKAIPEPTLTAAAA